MLLTGPVLLFEGSMEVRLKDGGGRCAGRVEVKHEDQWGTVFGGYWNMEDAAVVCKQLGCGSALEAPQYGHFGSGSGRTWLSDAGCRGTESALSDCAHGGWGKYTWDHRFDAGVKCSGFVQLVGGDSRCSGRVEIHDGDQWKTVCDSDFGPKAANVVCRDLQCGAALFVRGAAPFGEGVGPIWDRELQCAGNESFLMFCPRGSPRDQPCTRANAVSVTCTRFRLVNGSTACEGRVEVEVLGTWGTLCASHWDLSDAHVLCHHLNCGFAESIPRGGHFGRGIGPVWRDSFHCDGTETHLGQCPMTALGASPCSHENNAAVICSDPTRGRTTGSGRLSLPIIMCIILGALVCLLLALLSGQVRSARAGHRGSGRDWEPFPEAVYEEIRYSPAWGKQERFSGSGSCSEGTLTKLQPCPGDSKEEDGPGPAPDFPVLPRGDPADGYDDAREVSEPGKDPASGQGDFEMPRASEEAAGARNGPGGMVLLVYEVPSLVWDESLLS
ncbi:scavenger receptor cysteine-rich type 1 protein M130 [Egretta garzetta]|uniref:scavenger receptor cysteine-rich type 1 protein M130 n=1 Tax=Egretta garzetta TaxID=188379 RepID=UPI00163D28C6|nr:scavenger receptor cysteine-rich type 1 protein M130 [Egretta garzetta]